MKVEQKIKELVKGFIDTIPLGISASIYGLVYGVMACKAGLSVFETMAMSAFVFAGASQMTAVQMIAIGSSPVSIIVTVLIINLRHFLLAASLSPYLKHESNRMRMVNAFFMTDESYAVAYSRFQTDRPTSRYFLGSGLNIYVFWGSAGIIGYFFGNIISSQLNYIFDFAFIAAFIGMIVPMVKDFPVVVTVVVSGIISIIGSQLIPGKWYIIIAGVAASLAGYLASELTIKDTEADRIKGGIDYEH
ncbi:AzlC family ABC transporter permease [Cellulosilyticum sp. I15G10I2]|uniref:AzlC family ABC transporter permease n=1 Tax=Cellulosilyticum sp. I15G10I2 TaxID=1892843 RepID=UPI00085C3030|nr:AzlC family ABC transporter permease [Cellulosilyticum sp. I15G10I2]